MKFLLTFLFLFGSSCVSPLEAQINSKKFIVVLDPGHGGLDPGAIGENGTTEKDINLWVAREILNFSRGYKNLNIYMTRYNDTLISLNHRTNLTKRLKANLFISIHCNHSTNSFARGNEIFVALPKFSEHLENSILVAYDIANSLNRENGLKSRGIKFSNFQVLTETTSFLPAVLIELAFLSNREEEEFLADAGNLKFIASSIFKAILKQMEQ